MKKTALVILSFLLGLSCSVMAQETFSEFKILTYNIYHGENPDSLGVPNLDNIANLIILLQPEVVALQEVDSMTTRLESIYGKKIDWVAELGKKTGYRSYFADSLPNPAFFVGDLNFDPSSEAYQSINSKWSDAGYIANDDTPTFNSPEGKRIDYVWFDSEHFELVKYQVIDVPFSDHYPVLVTLRLIKPYK